MTSAFLEILWNVLEYLSFKPVEYGYFCQLII